MTSMDSANERSIALQGGRTLAYTTSGNASSMTVLLYLHGAFTVGEAHRSSRALTSRDIHYVCPTLPGWGNTSPPPQSTSYIDCLTSDMTTLLDHLYPDRRRDIRLFVAGGSFGTVPAQILYGTPYDKFPYGRCIERVLLMAPLSPFFYDKLYAKQMSWGNYMMVGPFSQWAPIRYMMLQLVRFGMGRKMSTVEDAEKFLRAFLFDKMGEAEKAEYAQWRAKEGIAEGETERRLAENAVHSVARSWEGFKLMAPVLHMDWGFRPDGLDERHSRPSVMMVTSPGDKEAPQAWTDYLAASYKNTRVKTLRGGHICILFYMDEVWEEFLAGVE